MKDYKEMADSVYEAVKEENFKRAKRASVLRKTVPCCCALGAAVAAAAVMGNMGKNIDLNPGNYQIPDTLSTETAAAETHDQYELTGYDEETNHYTEETAVEVTAAEGTIAEETIAEETNAEETNAEETNAEETNAEETNAEETNAEETIAEETVKEDPAAFDKLMWPVDGGYISQWTEWDGGYAGHKGIDIAGVEYGANVYAGADGIVTEADWSSGLGYYVSIYHEDLDATSTYGHNSRLFVEKGQSVKQGECIAAAGSTGQSTGICVHFGIQVDGSWVNPKSYLDIPSETVIRLQ